MTSSLSTEYLANLEMAALSERLRDLEDKLARAKEEKKQLALQKNGLTISDLTPGISNLSAD